MKSSTTITRRTSVDPDLPDLLVWLLDHRPLLLVLFVELVAMIGVMR